MISLRRRLSLGLMVSLIVLLVLQWGAATYAINQLTEKQLVSRLQQEGEALLAGVEFDTSGAMTIDAGRIGSVYQRPFSGHYYVVSSADQRTMSRSLWDASLDTGAEEAGAQSIYRLTGPERQPLLAVANGYRKQDRDITVVVAEDVTALRTGMMRFQLVYAVVSVIGLVLLLVIQRLIVLGALKPLQSVRDHMVRLERGEADRVNADGPEEIMPLIEELNRLLGAMVRKTKRSRESLGNLAHSLKTRLTLLNQMADSAEINAHPQLRVSIHQLTEAMNQTVERELKRARLIGDVHPGRRVDLNAEIGQLSQTLQILYAKKGVDIELRISPDSRFAGDAEDLLEFLGNVLDNACKWCRSKVLLTVSGSQVVSFVVEDDGPGCSASVLDTLVRRGYRADESRPGSGLGLAIVQDIVESYGGHLAFDRSRQLGGLRVEARFFQKASA